MTSRGLFSDSYWYWLSIGALVGFNILFNFLYTLALHYLDRESLQLLHMILADFIPTLCLWRGIHI
jgi:hypothetical protein